MNTYQLSNEKIKVSFTTLGGTLCSIQDVNGLEYLWQGDKEYWSGQAPVLFPICGSIRDDRAQLKNGKTIQMPRHGLVRKKEFSVVDQSKDSITFGIRNTEEMREQFPFEFRLFTKYKLIGDTIKITYIVENTGVEKMPFQIGGHPGFQCPLKEDEVYEDYEIRFEYEENCSVPTPVTETGLIQMTERTPFLDHTSRLQMQHALFHKDAVILDELKSRKAKLISNKTGHGVELDFGQFPYLILWSSANDGPFVALEPWVGLSTCDDESDVFEEKRNMQFVESNSYQEYSYSIRIF